MPNWTTTLRGIEQWNHEAEVALAAGLLPAEPTIDLTGLGPLPEAHAGWAAELHSKNMVLAGLAEALRDSIGEELDETRRQQRAQRAAVVPVRSAFLDRSA